MISSLIFLRTTVLLLIEGAALAAVLLPSGSWMLPLAMSLPLAAFVNVLLVFIFTIAGVPLSTVTILGGHLIVTAAAVITVYRKPALLMDQTRPAREMPGRNAKIVVGLAGLLIAMNAVYSFSHAVLLPSNQYDSATNWTMRSEISFVDQKIAFDPDESRGMAKPQYPFLFHAIQITANQSLTAWSDTAANSILYLLSICTFCSLYILIKRLRGTAHSAVTIASLVGIPLVGLHLAQGYGDLNLVQYLLLALACLGLWIEEDDRRSARWLMLSGIFISAAVWTKSEGSVFGLAPWILVIALLCFRDRTRLKAAIAAVTVSVALSIPWPIFAWAKDLSLTPHSSDTMVGFHPEGVSEALLGLFSRGSFGIDWYALLILIPALVVFARKKDPATEPRQLPLFLIGGIVFAQVLFIYLCTPNVRYLLNAESYYRQMMVPAALLLLACALILKSPKKDSY